jgi:twitching motility two-component system response regulator PilG
MAIRKTFSIAPICVAESDLRILKSLSFLTANRPRSYLLCGADEAAEIYLVDVDNPDSVREWNGQRLHHPAPEVLISGTGKSTLGTYVVKRPIIPSRLLAMLDNVTVKEWHFVPENIIGDEAAVRETLTKRPGTLRTEATAARFTALVVDDSTTVRKQIELGLQPFLVDVDCVDSGEEALVRISENNYSIIFLDVILPGADGYQICRAIRKNPATKKTPVVMLTSKSSSFDKIRGSMAGCDTYLTKPVDNATFQEVVKKYLKVVDTEYATAMNPAVLASG